MKRARFRIFPLLSLVLAVVMMLALVGCGDTSDGSEDNAVAQTTVSTTVTTTTTTTTTTTDTDAPTTGTEAPTTVVAPTAGTTAPTKKPTTATTTVKTTVPPVDPDHVFEDVPDALDGQKIRMLVWWDATEDRKRAANYASKTGIQVQFETTAVEDYQSALYAKILSGTPPHTAAIRSEWYPLPITRGLMQPIKNTGWDYSNKEDDIYALSMMEQFSYKGDIYGVALKGSRMSSYNVLFFNKEMLAANGVSEDPYQLWKRGAWNWDTCLDIALACTDARKERYGLTNVDRPVWMLSAGQDFVLSDANGLINNVKSPDLLKTWEQEWDMICAHKVVPTNFSQQKELFYSQNVAMLGASSEFMQTDAATSGYVPQNADFEWGVVPFPSPADMSAISGAEGVVWGFPTDVTGDQLQAAMWWLRYYLDDATYGDRDVYANEQSWEVLQWMSSRGVKSHNSVAVVTYGGRYCAWSIWPSLIDEFSTKAAIKVNLHKWYNEVEQNIAAIESGL